MVIVKWRFGILAGIIIALFGLYPQFALWNERGGEWNGTFASNDLDEVAYAAYLQALIDGRPRKNDPYSGRDESTETPQPESIFSIQFLPPVAISIPARLFGLNALCFPPSRHRRKRADDAPRERLAAHRPADCRLGHNRDSM